MALLNKSKSTLFCENCDQNVEIVENRKQGDISCSVCGMVLSDHVVDETQEWRNFSDDNENNRNRVGGPANPLLSGNGLGTIIGRKDFKGNNAQNSMDSGVMRMQIFQSLSSMDRSLVEAENDIKGICGRLGMEDKPVIDLSCQIYKEVLTRHLLKGRNSEAVKVVCVYISCRVEGLTRSIKEICEIMGLEKKVFNKTFTFIKEKMELKLGIISGERFVKRFCSTLDMPIQDTNAVRTVVETIVRDELLSQGKNPLTIVAVSIYFISFLSGVNLDYKRISEVCSISEATIRIAYGELYSSLTKLVPSNWTPKVSVKELPVPTLRK